MIDSDATVIFTYDPPSGGSLKTITYVHRPEKPWHEVDLLHTTLKQAVKDNMMWLAGDEEWNDYDEYVVSPSPIECILNVAGSRQSQAQGIQETVFRLAVKVLLKVNITSKHFQYLREV